MGLNDLKNGLGLALLAIFQCALLVSCQPGSATLKSDPSLPGLSEEEEADPAEIALGERLFRETRFAQYFAAHANGDVNAMPAIGDPVMDSTLTLGDPLVGPYKGKAMNCAACHLVDEQASAFGGGMRTYSDFARRSPIPDRLEDDKFQTPRNSPPLVNSALAPSDQFFLHFDGEFGSVEALVKAAYSGRNFGWLPMEKAAAIANLAKVIREDDGSGELASGYASLSYAQVLAGTDPAIPEEYLLPEGFRIDVSQSSDEEIFTAVSKLVAAYTRGLVFSQDTKGQFNASPYDQFLRKNHLPTAPEDGESELEYSRRLLSLIQGLENPYFIQNGRDGSFAFHNQAFSFGPKELAGLQIFFAEASSPLSSEQISAGKLGNCVACHAAPNFTDFKFHNTGASQEEYDGIHGLGAFALLSVPGFAARQMAPESYLPATEQHPNGIGKFLDAPSLLNDHTDLGLWNVFGNEDHPNVQDRLRAMICAMNAGIAPDCSDETLLPLTLALFKTPGLRDLGHGAPYMHHGQLDTLEQVLRHYKDFSNLARLGQVRNGAPELSGIALQEGDFEALAAFLNALNEDYN